MDEDLTVGGSRSGRTVVVGIVPIDGGGSELCIREARLLNERGQSGPARWRSANGCASTPGATSCAP